MDLFVVPTVGFGLLYAIVIVRLGRRDLVWINVTAHPTAQWVVRQIAEAFPWNEAPRYMIRDHDRWFLIQLYRWFPSILQVLTIVRPETLVRWHRAGFRCYWRWKSRAHWEGDRRSTRSCAH